MSRTHRDQSSLARDGGRERRTRRRRAAALGIVLAVAAVAAVALVRNGAATLGSGPAEAQGGAVARVTRRSFGSSVKATGVVRPEPAAEVRLGVPTSGILKGLHVRLGDRVNKGQLLAEIDTTKLEARRQQATAVLRSSEASARFEQSNLARKRALAAEQVISASELDLAERGAALAEASVVEAQANLEFIRTEIRESRLIAPFGGIVAALGAEEGEMVPAVPTSPSGAPTAAGFLTLLDVDRLELWAFVDETDIGKIELEQPVRFTVDAYPGLEMDGRVSAIRPKPELRDNVVNYVALIGFAPPRARTLRPEMTANVHIMLQRRDHVLSVPRNALHRAQGRAYVLLPQLAGTPDTGEARKREVTAGSCDETACEIVDGLREGDLVSLRDAREGLTGDRQAQTD